MRERALVSEDVLHITKLVGGAILFCEAIGADPNPERLQRIIKAASGLALPIPLITELAGRLA
jgi:hypothetical protein